MSLKYNISTWIAITLLLMINLSNSQSNSEFDAATSKVDSIFDKSIQLAGSNPKAALKGADEMLRLARELEYDDGLMEAYILFSHIHSSLGDNKEALEYAEKGLLLAQQNECDTCVVKFHILKGEVYRYQGEFGKTLETYSLALQGNKLITEFDKFYYVHTCQLIAQIFMATGEHSKVFQYLDKANDFCEKEGYSDERLDPITIALYGKCQMDLGLYEEAILSLKEALIAFEKGNVQPSHLVVINQLIGTLYAKKGDKKLASSFMKKAVVLAEEIGFVNEHYTSLVKLAQIYIDLGEISLAEKVISEAEEIFGPTETHNNQIVSVKSDLFAAKHLEKTALNQINEYLVEGNFSPAYESELRLKAASMYEKLGDYENAYSFHTSAYKINDSIDEANKTKKLDLLEIEYRVDNMQRDLKEQELNLEIAKREARINDVKFQYAWIVGLILLIASILVIHKYKQNLEARKKIIKSKEELKILEQKMLNDEIDFKNQQITDFALHISEKNDLLMNIKNMVRNSNGGGMDKASINDLIIYINSNLSQNEEKVALYSSINDTKDAFYHKITKLFPELTEKEKKVAIYVRLEWSTKQIASHLGLTVSSIDNYRHSLRKKMLLDKSKSLKQFLKHV